MFELFKKKAAKTAMQNSMANLEKLVPEIHVPTEY